MNAACRYAVSTRFAAFPAHTPCNTRHVHRRSTLGSSLLLLPATACCPPPLLQTCVLAGQNAHPRRLASVQPGAAGVSQPWFRKHACSSNTAMVARRRPVGGLCTNTVAIALPYHGGLTPAALDQMCVCASQKSFFFGRRAHSETRAGGRKPPVLSLDANAPAIVSIVPAVSRDCTAAFLQVRFPNVHGGLTPAALDS